MRSDRNLLNTARSAGSTGQLGSDSSRDSDIKGARPQTWVVVPCFNEEARLPSATFVDFATQQPDIGFIFVDDGSTDSTLQQILRLCDQMPGQAIGLQMKTNSGKAEAVRRGIQAAIQIRATYTGYWDADLATPLEALIPMRAVAHHRSELVAILGCRIPMLGRDIRRKPLRRFQSRLFAKAASRVLKTPVFDTQCGAKLLRISPIIEQLFGSPFLTRWIFDVEWLARLSVILGSERSLREAVYEFPLDHWHEVEGSKLTLKAALKAATQLSTIARQIRPSRWTPRDDSESFAQNVVWHSVPISTRHAA